MLYASKQLLFLLLVIIIVVLIIRSNSQSEENMSSQESRTRFVRSIKDHSFCDLSEALTYSDVVKAQIKCRKQKNEQGLDHDPMALSSFQMTGAVFRVAKEYNIGNCVVQKSMSTVLQNMLCYLQDSDRFVENNRSITKDTWSKRFCGETNEYGTYEGAKSATSKNLPVLFVPRDPTQRFISSFMDKCINELAYSGIDRCFGCKGDITCVLEKFYEVMKLREKGQLSPEVLTQYSIFIVHTSPQTWHCDLSQNYENYHFVRFGATGKEQEEMMENIMRFLRSHGVPEDKIQYIEDSLKEQRTGHSTVGSSVRDRVTRKLLGSPHLLQLLERIYKYDYEVFQFGTPSARESS